MIQENVQNKDFTIQELKENPSFRRMVRGIADTEEIEYWNQWMESSDENRQKAKEALTEIMGFEFQSPHSTPDIEREWHRISTKTVEKSGKRVNHIRRKRENIFKWIVRAAAILLLVGLASVGVFYLPESDQSLTHLEELIEERTIKTSDGEQKILRFSNDSKVVLNSNSSLIYSLHKPTNTIRITLEGEAWFEADSEGSIETPAFEITTPDGIIRDIGTQFLVTVQNQQSRVIIQEGIVEVESANFNATQNPQNGNKFRVENNEMVEFTTSEILQRESVNPTFYTSWATGYMRLEKTNIEELAYYIEQQFGVNVIVKDHNLKNITLDGTVYFRSLEELIRSVSEVVTIQASRSEDRKTVFIDSEK